MTTVLELYDVAMDNGIIVDSFELKHCESLSLMDSDGDCLIAVDPWKLTSCVDEKVKLAHELGHCVTGSFYNVHSSFDIIEKREYTANKWAAHKLLPFFRLKSAMNRGAAEIWQIAEEFDLTEDFVATAIDIYKREGAI